MAVYFFAERDPDGDWRYAVKVGYSNNIPRRLRNLQTGNPREISVMGFIRTEDCAEDRRVEADLHRRLKEDVVRGEWFSVAPEQIFDALHSHSTNAFLATEGDPFEIIGLDRDAIPVYANPWHWGEFEVDEFCPRCGWACGLTDVETAGGMMCLECGAHEAHYQDRGDEPDWD